MFILLTHYQGGDQEICRGTVAGSRNIPQNGQAQQGLNI